MKRTPLALATTVAISVAVVATIMVATVGERVVAVFLLVAVVGKGSVWQTCCFSVPAGMLPSTIFLAAATVLVLIATVATTEATTLAVTMAVTVAVTVTVTVTVAVTASP